jgi:very-short-patch-repair endonuclease
MRKRLTNNARLLRRQATPAEQKLWAEFRKQSVVTKIKFRRQQPIEHYITDFYCAEHRCVIEIDGSSHDYRQTHNAKRDAYMRQNNMKVLRFIESEALRDPFMVIKTICLELGIPLTSKN